MIKKKLVALGCICLCLSFTACKKDTSTVNQNTPAPTQEAGQNNEENETKVTEAVTVTPEPTAEPTAEPTEIVVQAPKEAVIVNAVMSDTLKSEDESVVLLIGNYEYPQIENTANDPNIDKINQAIKDFTQKKYEEVYATGKEYALSVYPQIDSKETMDAMFPYEAEAGYEVTFNKNNLVSVRVSTYANFGGAHPSTEDFSYTYDTLTGEEVPISYFYGESEEDAKQYVAQSFYTVFNEEPEQFYDNAGEILSSGAFDYGWYLTKDGLSVFINPYIIAPYVAGMQEMTFAYDPNVTMFHHLERVTE